MPVVIYEKKGRIAYITMNRPEAYNAINLEMWDALFKAWLDFRDDPEVWTAILTGTGKKVFSAGADLKEIDKYRVEAEKEGTHLEPPPPWFTITRGIEIWKPVIAAINGLALGGGLEIALACDIRIAADNAQLGVPEVKAGVIPGVGGTQRLSRFIPFGSALQMLMTGDPISAQEAYRIGLVNMVVPMDQLMSTAESLAQRINENAPLAVRAAKEAAYRGLRVPLEEGLRMENLLVDMLLHTRDGRAGPAAFAAGKKPLFEGR